MTSQACLSSAFPLFRGHPNHVDSFNSFDFFNFDIFDLCGLLLKIQRLTISSVWRERCLYRKRKRAMHAREGRYVNDSHIPPQVDQVVRRSTVSEGIWIVGFRSLWPLVGA